jgi:potassium-transporting ATPase KdpC subunit
MFKELKAGILITVVFTVLTGLMYPLAMTGIVQIVFPRQANGSLIARNGKVIGSELIGQNFTKPEYFHSRPSAAGNGYDATASSGSNLGPTNPALTDRLNKGAAAYRQENPSFSGPIPADAITTSGSGLDPDISPGNAVAQCARVASARGVTADQIRTLVSEYTENRTMGLFGEPRVNVLHLNVALDERFPLKRQ